MNIIRKTALLKKLGISKSTLYNWLSPKSVYHDPSFPQPFKIGHCCIGFDEADVDTWLESKKNKFHTAHASPAFKVIAGTAAISRAVASNELEAA